MSASETILRLFRHTDGGLYEFMHEAKSSADQSPVIVYQHLWPFERCLWTRPKSEWAERFTPITLEEYEQDIVSMTQAEGQELVTRLRNARKAREAIAANERQAAALDRLGLVAKASTNLGAVIEQLEGRNIHVGSKLYDAHGRAWIARDQGADYWAVLLSPAGPADANSDWHTNQYREDGVQCLYWENPQAGLKLRWEPIVVSGRQAWTVNTVFGSMQVRCSSNGTIWSWILSIFQSTVNEEQDPGVQSSNQAMRDAELYLQSRMTKERLNNES